MTTLSRHMMLPVIEASFSHRRLRQKSRDVTKRLAILPLSRNCDDVAKEPQRMSGIGGKAFLLA